MDFLLDFLSFFFPFFPSFLSFLLFFPFFKQKKHISLLLSIYSFSCHWPWNEITWHFWQYRYKHFKFEVIESHYCNWGTNCQELLFHAIYIFIDLRDSICCQLITGCFCLPVANFFKVIWNRLIPGSLAAFWPPPMPLPPINSK